MERLPLGHELSRDWVRLDEEMSHHYVEYGIGMHSNIYPYLEKLRIPLVSKGLFYRNSLVLNVPVGEGDNRGVFRWLLRPEGQGQIHLANAFIRMPGLEDVDSFVLAAAVLDSDNSNYIDHGTFEIASEGNKDSILSTQILNNDAEINNFLAFQIGLSCVEPILYAIGKKQASLLYPEVNSEAHNMDNLYVWETSDVLVDAGESPDMAFDVGKHKILLHSKRARVQHEISPRIVYYTVVPVSETVFRSSYGISSSRARSIKTCDEGLIEILDCADNELVSDGFLGIKINDGGTWENTFYRIVDGIVARILPAIDCKCPR